MRTPVLLLLCLCCGSGFAACDTNVLALGDWSEPVANSYGLALRARLLICQEPCHRGAGGLDTGLYVELEEHSDFVGGEVEVYCKLGGEPGKEGLRCDLTDSKGRTPPFSQVHGGGGYGGGAPVSCWVTIPPYGGVRLRASVYGGGWLEDGGLGIWCTPTSGWWTIKGGDTNAYFLSGTFTVDPPTNHVAHDFRSVWAGTLKLPRMRLPVQKP